MTLEITDAAVVEAMARALWEHERVFTGHAPSDDIDATWMLCPEIDRYSFLEAARFALSAALATGEIMATNKHEEALGKVIDEREEIAEAFSQAYFLVVGVSPPFSSAWGLSHALEEIEEACALLRVAATGSVVICSPELRKLMERAVQVEWFLRSYSTAEAKEAIEAFHEAGLAFARAHQEDKG